MRIFIILILSCASVLGADISTATNRIGEMLIPLKAGEDARGIVSYGLFVEVSASSTASNSPAGGDLFLFLRNAGANSINMEGVSVEDFNLLDSHGRVIKLNLWTSPRTLEHGDSTVIHIVVDHPEDAVQPWTLYFKTKPAALVPIDLTISGVEPRKK
jgi:hypothetical protein